MRSRVLVLGTPEKEIEESALGRQNIYTHVIPGLERAGLSLDERRYFDLHTEQDIDHAQWMSEALEKLATGDKDRAAVRRGASLSLDARYRVWTGIERQIVALRQPVSIEAARRGLQGQNTRSVDTDSPGTAAQLMAAVDAHLGGAPWPVPPRAGKGRRS